MLIKFPVVLFATLLSTYAAATAPPEPLTPHSLEHASEHAVPAIGWVANAGQWHEDVAFRVDTPSGATFLLRSGEFVHQLTPSGSTVRERLLGATQQTPTGTAPRDTRVSYFYGADPSRWQSNQPTYGEVSSKAVYPGVDMLLRLHEREVEKIFTVHPGADAAQIRFKLEGGEPPRLDAESNVLVALPDGATELKITAPKAWQGDGKARQSVAIDWALADDGSFGFRLGSYDTNRTLMIDPVIRTTYYGGAARESGFVFIAPNGDPYFLGSTQSTDLPGTAGGAQATSNATSVGLPSNDAFVARLTPDLTSIRQATYLGGTGDEINASAAFVDGSDDLIVAGTTNSTDFPGTTGGAQPSIAGGLLGGDAYLARLSGDLTSLVQSTYLGGSGDDTAFRIQSDTLGSVYVLGTTGSNDFPATTGGAQATRGDVLPTTSEGFVAKLPEALTSIEQATYYGGSNFDLVQGLLLNSNGLYISGATTSTDLPGTAGGAQPALDTVASEPFDAFVALLNPGLTSIIQATYYGGDGLDSSAQIQELGGGLYLSGITQSSNLPGAAGGAQPAYAGGTPVEDVFDAFIVLLNPGLTSVTQATYFGGTGVDAAFPVRQGSGNIYLSGTTTSADLPGTAGAAQPNYAGAGANGLGDSFIAAITPNLQTLVRTTYLGGSGDDGGGAQFAPDGALYISGSTTSPDFPGVTGGFQEVYGGAGANGIGDVFVALVSADLTTLTQATYFGGSGDDSGGILFGETVDDAYIAGDTTSPNLGSTTGAVQPEHANTASTDMFLAKVTPNLTGGGGGGPAEPSGPVFGAALPGQRVYTLGGPGVTFFGTIINSGDTIAVGCSIALGSSIAATFSYQTTNSDNQLIGSPNTPADIAAGGSQSFLFTITPTQAFASTQVELVYDCDNTDPAAVIAGVNTVDVLSTSTATPDVVAIVLTTTGDGIAHIPGATGSVAVAMATVNVGATGEVTLTTDTGSASLGVTVTVCQTNPADSLCLSPPVSELTLTIANNETPTFSVFITGSQIIPLDPAANRLNLRFLVNGNTQVGQSSLALWTDPP